MRGRCWSQVLRSPVSRCRVRQTGGIYIVRTCRGDGTIGVCFFQPVLDWAFHPCNLCYILNPFVLLPVLWVWGVRKNARTKGLPLPPGPKRWPIVGNLFNLPSGKTWMVYDQLFKRYGSLVAHLSEQNSYIFRRYHILRALGSAHRSSWFH